MKISETKSCRQIWAVTAIHVRVEVNQGQRWGVVWVATDTKTFEFAEPLDDDGLVEDWEYMNVQTTGLLDRSTGTVWPVPRLLRTPNGKIDPASQAACSRFARICNVGREAIEKKGRHVVLMDARAAEREAAKEGRIAAKQAAPAYAPTLYQ